MQPEVKDLINEIQESLVIAESKQKKAEALLDQLKTALQKESNEPEEFLTAFEVADKFRTSVQVIRNKTSRNALPFVKFGKRTLYPAKEIELLVMKDKYNAICS